MKYDYLFSVILFFSSIVLQAQDVKPKYAFGGYIRYMPSVDFSQGLDSLLTNQLIHNRLNFSWFPDKNLKLHLELRNRIFYGDYVERLYFFNQLVDIHNDQIDLSLWLVDENSLKMLSEIDRAYFAFSRNNWEVSAGRQRINWGINKIWNPNDIFNAYSFFNFDYTEKPSSDALRITYHYKYSSKLEAVSKFAVNIEDYTGAFLWKLNQSGYNVQLLAGLMENNVVVGTGWAGSIGTVGFNGEVSYFSALEARQNDALVASISAEYIFAPEAHLLISYFYNSNGVKNPNMEQFALVSSLSYNAKNQMPFSSAALIQIAEPITADFYASMTTIWFPGNNGGYFGPGISYKASDKLKLAFISQMFTAEGSGIFDPASFQVFFRAAWRF